MLLIRWISSSWFEQNIENGKRYRHVQKFLYHSKRKECIPFSYTVFITKGSRETCLSKTEKTYFQVKHGKSCQYVILRTTQLTMSHIFKSFKQYIKQRTAFWLLSIKLVTASQKCGLGEIGISIARASQIKNLFIYLFIYLFICIFIYFFNYLFIRKLYLLEVILLDWIIKLKRSIIYVLLQIVYFQCQ